MTGPIVAALVVASTLVACGEAERPTRPPNIVLVVVDTLRADRLGCSGNQRGLTPRIDELAARGVVFRHAYAPSSWTLPSIASLLTSRHQHSHGVVGFGSTLRESEITLPEVLYEHGYVVAAFGANALLGAEGFRQGFDLYDFPAARTSQGLPPRAAEVNDKTLLRLERLRLRRGSERPVFLYVHYMEPHPPYGDTAKLHAVAGRDGLPDLAAVSTAMLRAAHAPLAAGMLRSLLDVYDAEVAEVDDQIGRLLEALAAERLLDEAIVVVTADHGEEFDDHGGVGHGRTLYDEVIRVPLVMIVPGRREPLVVEGPVGLVDVAPTLLDLAGIPVPDSFDGRSFSSAISGEGFVATVRRLVRGVVGAPGVAYSALVENTAKPDPAKTLRAVVRGSQKLIATGDTERSFYDLRSDPDEREGIDLPAAQRDRLERLLADIASLHPGEQSIKPLDAAAHERLRALGYAN